MLLRIWNVSRNYCVCIALCASVLSMCGFVWGLSAYYHIVEETTSEDPPPSKYVRRAWSRNGATAYLYLTEA